MPLASKARSKIRFLHRSLVRALIVVLGGPGLAAGAGQAGQGKGVGGLAVMPVPAVVHPASGRLAVTESFSAEFRGSIDPRVQDALSRLLQHWHDRTGIKLSTSAEGRNSAAVLVVDCETPGNSVPALGEDESYSLKVSAEGAVLHAHTTTGGLRGLATLELLLANHGEGWCLPAVIIEDAPRFPWRGLLIDVSRHWQPLEVLERNLEAMALVKLNVLHLHLTDDQGFRMESKRYPHFQETASDGHFFTQDQMRGLVAFAAARGIRVVPEFDMPGHVTSWVVAYPDLAAAPGPYELQRAWGVFDPVFDPTNEQVYQMLDGFLGEMATVFPDPYVHIGGDENNGKQWNANPGVQEFIREHKLAGNAGLHAWFNERVYEILKRHGRKLMGWEEILNPGLPKDSVVQSWRGEDTLAAAAREGYGVVLSKGYYIDLMESAAEHYSVDPDNGHMGLSPDERSRILGGEATMWSEWVDSETIDSRIWPRTAAIAERLWSPASVNNVNDMFRRLDIMNRRLEETGLLLTGHQAEMLRQLAGDHLPEETWEHVRAVASVVEPDPIARRRRLQKDSRQSTPLTGLVDSVIPDSEQGRHFTAGVRQYLWGQSTEPGTLERALLASLDEWKTAGDDVAAASDQLARADQLVPVARALADVSRAGKEALVALTAHQPVSDQQCGKQLAVLEQSSRLPLPVHLAIVPAIRLLVVASGVIDRKAAMSPADWQSYVEGIAQPARERTEGSQ